MLQALEPASCSPDRIFKVVFVGNSGVGKSSFIHRFCYDRFLGIKVPWTDVFFSQTTPPVLHSGHSGLAPNA
uniref:Uncharacterized protein n=1 Tax=Serinus canaria TaxID=9135 RepID=A0A8C9NLQ4_SERCA